MIYKKYDVVLDKAYNQMELAVLYFYFLEHRESVLDQPRPPPLQTILLPRVGGQGPSDPRPNLPALLLPGRGQKCQRRCVADRFLEDPSQTGRSQLHLQHSNRVPLQGAQRPRCAQREII